jgi:hypothetical protein
MNAITDILRQLVRRKLWPVALLLLGALAAVPFVLAKDPEPTAVAAANGAKVEAVPATFVSADEPTDVTKRRRVLGAEKDPFAPADLTKAEKKKRAEAKAKAKAAETAATDSAKSDTSSSGSSGTGGSGGAGGAGGTPPVAPAPTATPVPTTTVPAFAVKVRFGPTTDQAEHATKTYERMSVLPDDENPLLVYRGVEDGAKVAIFELTGKVDAQGDGTCLPTPEDCQYLKLHAGETEFLTLSDTGNVDTDAQFQLDVVKIYAKKTQEKTTADATAATESLAKGSSSSLKGKSKSFALRRRNRYVFDATSGTLHKVAKGAKTPLASL